MSYSHIHFMISVIKTSIGSQMFAKLSAILTACVLALPVWAAELVMVEQDGCFYCEQWDHQIAHIYPKTSEGKHAPLRRMDIHQTYPGDLNFARALTFTPTFVLIEDGQELARIEGYPGEDFFWGLLGMMLNKHTGYQG